MGSAADNYRVYLADPVALGLARAHGEATMRRKQEARTMREAAVAASVAAHQAAGQPVTLLNRGGFNHVERRLVLR